jgi:hypothetical protein
MITHKMTNNILKKVPEKEPTHTKAMINKTQVIDLLYDVNVNKEMNEIS